LLLASLVAGLAVFSVTLDFVESAFSVGEFAESCGVSVPDVGSHDFPP
jgi:hypothetical protein